MTDANLSGANLRDADLTAALLDGADLSGALFRNTLFSGASLIGADLSGSNARNADFSGALLAGADLSGMINIDPNAFAGAFYDINTVVDPGFDTSQMVFLPEPRPVVLMMMGLIGLAAFPDALSGERARSAAADASAR